MKRLFLFLGRHCRIPIVAGNELFWPTHLSLLRHPHKRRICRKKFLKLTEKPNFSNKNIFHARLNEPTNQTKKRLHKHTYPKKDNFSNEKISHNCLEEPITWHTHLTYQNNNFSKHALQRINFSPKGKVSYIYTKK